MSNKTKYETPAQRAEFMEKLMRGIQAQFLYLRGRWQDEKDYEDFEGYKSSVASLIKQLYGDSVKVKGMTKAFRMTLEIDGFPYNPIVYATLREYGWKTK